MPTFLKSISSRLSRKKKPHQDEITDEQLNEEKVYPHEDAFSQDADSQYTLRPLSTTKPKIRLFSLSDPTDPTSSGTHETGNGKVHVIRAGDLCIYDMDNCPPYLALSYEWGPPCSDNEATIVVFPQAGIVVRPNLFAFLGLLRWALHHDRNDFNAKAKMPWHIWVDQLCIDQSNDLERSAQVQNMSSIFSRAEGVVAWPGMPLHLVIGSGPWYLRDPAPFVQARYWGRLWVVQELILARRVFFLCAVINAMKGPGDEEDTDGNVHKRVKLKAWDMLMDALDHEARGQMRGMDRHFKGMREHRAQDVGGSLLPLATALSYYADCGCLDPRDKVFGLLGIVVPEQRLRVDYSKGPLAIFELAVGVILRYNAVPGTEGVSQNLRIVIAMLARDMGVEKKVEEAVVQLTLDGTLYAERGEVVEQLGPVSTRRRVSF